MADVVTRMAGVSNGFLLKGWSSVMLDPKTISEPSFQMRGFDPVMAETHVVARNHVELHEHQPKPARSLSITCSRPSLTIVAFAVNSLVPGHISRSEDVRENTLYSMMTEIEVPGSLQSICRVQNCCRVLALALTEVQLPLANC